LREASDGAGERFDLRAFLERTALVSDLDRDDSSDDVVRLMTLHTAKGLEFPVVFLVGVEENVLPSSRSIGPMREGDGLSEERRLMYVGITRAEQRLYMTWASQRRQFGEYKWNPPSRFLDDVPQDGAEWRGLAANGSSGVRYDDDDTRGDF